MDVMRPDLYWVGDRSYRRNKNKNDRRLPQQQQQQQQQQQSVSVQSQESHQREQKNVNYKERERNEQDLECPGGFDDDEDDYPMEKTTGGFKSMVDDIPNALYSVIIGKQGRTKCRIESETNTKIIVPRENDKNGVIVVRGQNPKDVSSCRRRLEIIANEARFRRDPTHFACIPLNQPKIINAVQDFKKKVLNEFKTCQGLDEHIFQDPEKLHLTISVLTLFDDRERRFATQLLKDIHNDILEIVNKKPLKVHLKGLEIMNDDPGSVDILYAKCDQNDDRVQKLADFISKQLYDSGFAKSNRGGPSVKLHATLINTRFRQELLYNSQITGRGGAGNSYNNHRETVDATQILKKYSEIDFGEIEIEEIHLSVRKTKAANGFYTATHKLNLSPNQ